MTTTSIEWTASPDGTKGRSWNPTAVGKLPGRTTVTFWAGGGS